MIPSNMILLHNPSANMPFFEFTGFLSMISFSGGSNPMAIAGKESVTKLIHNNWIANNGD